MLYFFKSKGKIGNDPLGAHYIAVSYNPSTDKFTAYNNNNNGKLEEGYNFTDFLANDHKLYCIWAIEDPNKPQNVGSASKAYEERY